MYLSFFNRDWYFSSNPDLSQVVATGLIDPEQHFLQYGIAEGRSPHPLFDAVFYLQTNPDVAAAVQSGHTSAVQHFLWYGLNEGRSAYPPFDVEFYLQSYPDVAAAVETRQIAAAQHFFLHGISEGRAINPVIHLGKYLDANPDVMRAAQAGQIDALSHLLTHGLREERDLGNGVSTQTFAADPIFAKALENGSAAAALARIAEIAPFLSTFRAPQGWTPPATTPIPLDFAPPAGVQLIVPASVKVPDSVTLPPQFLTTTAPPTPRLIPTDPETPTDLDSSTDSPSPAINQQTFTPNPGTEKGSSDASTAIALDANYMVVGDDGANVLRVYDRKGGAAVKEWDYTTTLALNTLLLDLEASTRIGDTLYFIGSHSNSTFGKEQNSREHLFAVKVSGTGDQTTFTYTGKYSGLESALVTWDKNDTHKKGANYFGFATSSDAGIIPEVVNGFSIEGMTASLDGSQLLLGFRAPQTSTGTRDKAVIIPLSLTSLFDTKPTPTFGTPIELNLGGRGIRSIEKSANGDGYLLLAGPAGSASADVINDFRLYRLSTDLATVTELDVSLDPLRDTTQGSFESIVEVLSTASGTSVQLLQDNGDTWWAGQTQRSNDLPAANQQFVGNWVVLGAPAPDDSTAPSVVNYSPGKDALTVFKSVSGITLRFNEGVKAGSGSFIIKDASNGDIVTTIAATDPKVSIAFNTVTIKPALDLTVDAKYYVETSGTALTDLNSNAWAGLSGTTAYAFTTTKNYSLLITEVNANGTGGDFFEIYNYGNTAVDLTGWKWIDDKANPAHDDARDFGAVTSLAAGATLIVITDQTNIAAFRSAWNNLGPGVQVTSGATIGPGLGGSTGDAVVVFDAADEVATAFNYKQLIFKAFNGTDIALATRSDGRTIASGHAGIAMGAPSGATSVSAIWDGVSTSNPTYKPAVAGQDGAIAQLLDATNIGSPGVIPGADTTGPSLGSPVVIDPTTKTVTVDFYENLINAASGDASTQAATLKAAVTYSINGNDKLTLGGSDTVAIDIDKLVITFAALPISNSLTVSVAAGALKDSVGNVNLAITTPAIDNKQPTITAFSVSGGTQLLVTSDESGEAALYKGTSLISTQATLAANNATAITISPQNEITKTTLRVSDAAGNKHDTPVLLGTDNGSTVETITGTASAEFIFGFAGNDVITGEGGADVIAGGAGADVFVYDVVAHWSATESITDYGTGGQNTTALDNAAIARLNGDVLRFDYSRIAAITGFKGGSGDLVATIPLSTNGSTLATGAIVQGAGAQTANAGHGQFLYNSTTGLLSIDVDGTAGTTAIVDIALIGTGKTLTATDILLVA